jgi:chemotaxis protein MotB
MVRSFALAALVLLAAAAASYLYLYRPQQEELAAARQQLSELRDRVEDLEHIRDRLERASSELEQKVLAREEELAQLRATQDELVSELQQEIADRQVQVERIRDRLRLDLVDEILFDSGRATLNPAGVDVLTKVGAVLKRAQGRSVEVQGHTDDRPIRGALSERFPSNWELSAARATNVVRFLQDEAGLDPGRLSATGYAEHQPRASNETPEGRRQNRRIEILLGPARPQETAAP